MPLILKREEKSYLLERKFILQVSASRNKPTKKKTDQINQRYFVETLSTFLPNHFQLKCEQKSILSIKNLIFSNFRIFFFLN